MSWTATFLGSLLATFSYFQNATQCPETTPVADFNATKYLGNWYQAGAVPFFWVPAGSQCVRATYGPKDDGTISVRNVCTYVDGKFGEACGNARAPDKDKPGKLLVNFGYGREGDYQVLDTDYDSYSAVYSCTSILGLFKMEYVWVLTRDQKVAPELIEKVKKVFTDQGISLNNFEVTYQEPDCSYERPDGSSCSNPKP